MKIFWTYFVWQLFWLLLPKFGQIFPNLLVTLKVTDVGKRTSLLRPGINDSRKKFYRTEIRSSCGFCLNIRPWTNFSLQDEPWAEFSTLEVAACVILCTYGPV